MAINEYKALLVWLWTYSSKLCWAAARLSQKFCAGRKLECYQNAAGQNAPCHTTMRVSQSVKAYTFQYEACYTLPVSRMRPSRSKM